MLQKNAAATSMAATKHKTLMTRRPSMPTGFTPAIRYAISRGDA